MDKCYDWMKKDQKDFTTKPIHEMRLDLSALQNEYILKYHNQDCNSETHIGHMNIYLMNELNGYCKDVIHETSHNPDEAGHCYSFQTISIFGFVLKFMKSLKRRSRKLPSDDQYKNILLLDEEIEVSQTFFFFQKATIEIKTFVRTSHYQQISIEKNGILYYTWENFAN